MRLGMKRRNFKFFPLIAFFIIILMFVLTAIAAKRLEPTFVSQAHSYANTMVTNVIEKAVNDVLSNGNYSETAHIIDSGSATSVEADTVKINKLKSELAVKIQNDIAAQCSAKIYIPLGSASKLYILSGWGPKIPVSIYPAAIVNTNYKESFESAGINQVRHEIAINVDVKMHYAGYMLDETEIINTDVPVLESIIVGNTPEYFGSGQMNMSVK